MHNQITWFWKFGRQVSIEFFDQNARFLVNRIGIVWRATNELAKRGAIGGGSFKTEKTVKVVSP